MPLAAELTERLADLGYTSVERLVDLPASELGRRVEDYLDSCDVHEVVIVHVIGHGVVHERTAKLLVVGSDGQAGARTEIERWLTAVEGRAGGSGPSVLFLVDLCYSGTITRLEWQGYIPDEQRRAWVIAATGQRDLAYAGRFSRAIAVVLTRIAAGALDISASFEFVPVERVAREIRREVDRLSEDRYEQRVVSVRCDPAAIPNFPFIRNPAFVGGPQVRIDDTTRPFLDGVDEALDWRHFAGRAAGGSLEIDGDRIRPGAFRGRRGELRIVAAVLDAPAPHPCLVLVTGSPGVGKSALLGITVCAAHPELSDLTEPLWRDRRDELPAIHPGLAAVHCRQRHLGEIVAALARQLDVPVTTADPSVLLTALRDSMLFPTVVLDALDESMKPVGVMADLVLPLSAVARVVVGVRPWREFDPLRWKATTVIDLDDVPAAELRADLAAYVDDLLRPAYRTPALRASRQVIAQTVASALTEQRTVGSWDDGVSASPEDVVRGDQWGAFLVAGLFAHQLRNRPAITDPSEAMAAGRAVPRTLPEVFELDLAASAGRSWRPVLTVLAWSFGAGIPRSLVDAVVGPVDAGAVLDAARFYLRRDVDEDGTVLYRLFHQGLADHLRRQDLGGMKALFITLMSTLGSPPRWRDAEPYLLRHAIDHAATVEQRLSVLDDPGFVAFGSPDSIGRGSSLMEGRRPSLTGLVYQKSVWKHRHLDAGRRRAMLVIDAHRLGHRDVAERLAQVADLSPLTWTPRWATMDQRDAQTWGHSRINESGSLVIGGRSDAPLVAISDWTGLSVTNVGTGAVSMVGEEYRGLLSRCLAVGHWADRVVACVLSGQDTCTVWDVANQVALFTCTGARRFDHVAFGEDSGTQFLAIVDASEGLTAWRLPDGLQYDTRRFTRPITAVTVGAVASRAVVVSAHGRRLELVRITGAAQRVSIDTGASIAAVAVADLDGRGIVLCGHQDGTVDLRSAEDLTRIHRLVQGELDETLPKHIMTGPLAVGRRHGVPVAFVADRLGFVSAVELDTGVRWFGVGLGLALPQALLPVTTAGRPLVLAANYRTAIVSDIDTGEQLDLFTVAAPRPAALSQDGRVVGREHNGAIRGVAVLDDVLATASTDRTVRLWDLRDGTSGLVLEGHGDWVHTVALARVGDRRAALSGGIDCQARLWDVDSGETLRVFTGHKGWIRAAAFAPGDERHAVTAAHDGTARMWNLDTGHCVRVFGTAKRTALTSVACGRYVVAGSTNGLVHVWRSEQPNTFSGHQGAIWAIALSHADGEDVVLSGGEDRIVRMWRLSDGACVQTFTGFTTKITTLSAGRWRDRPVLLAGGEDGTVLGWDLENGGLLAEVAFPGPVGAVGLGAEGVVVVGFGNDVGVIHLHS
ncbi:hypothetical protein BU204_27125 [Actinophytocola xanthii]|uniref:Uncharacterized protein n=1 Tax=Actinophytocola xanthii TaxID=1912961 RepID=A0A1Q8CGE8_9PSEU|nr:hypothetical protein BU204_27125 [Actinophytocola xanthii]